VLRLVAIGVLVTWAGVAAAAALLFDGLGKGVPVLIGAILVVSGPTVVLPLLAFVRPNHAVRTLLMWEGVLVDPVGALLGVVVFHAVLSAGAGEQVMHPGAMLLSVATGAAVGLTAAALLLALLREVQRTAPRQAIPATLMLVVAALVAADVLRDDAGFVATTLMGMVLANQRRIDVSLLLDFQATLVQLLIGVLFILIAASVSPSDVQAVLPEALVLVVVMVLVIRPLAVALATRGSPLRPRERLFVAWLAPRGIVAGATASAFGLQLAQAGVAGADRILPIAFVAILGTVALYGLTAAPVARVLSVAGAGGTTVLVVGGHAWARALAQALKQAGVGVRVWVGRDADQVAARQAGLPADRGHLMVDAITREAELEEITDALVLTPSDDFNALATAALRTELGHSRVHRVAPGPDTDLLPPSSDSGVLGGAELTFDELARRFGSGEHLVATVADGAGDVGGSPWHAGTPLFVVTRGSLRVAADGVDPVIAAGDTVIALAAGAGAPSRPGPSRASAGG
jgi:NhaP-type Na+/H+ or K+/H+ antiporter